MNLYSFTLKDLKAFLDTKELTREQRKLLIDKVYYNLSTYELCKKYYLSTSGVYRRLNTIKKRLGISKLTDKIV